MTFIAFILLSCLLCVGSFPLRSQLRRLDRYGYGSVSTPNKLRVGLDIDNVVREYHAIMESNGLLADMVTVLATNTLSDTLAQTGERSKAAIDGTSMEMSFDFKRLLRFATFGFMDGAVAHAWFIALDKVIVGTDVTAVVQKIFLDTLIYTPTWCAWFVVAMALMKGNNIAKALKYEWKELAFIDLGFYLPLAIIVYSSVPLESRVTVFAIASVVYTVIVSLWNERKRIQALEANIYD